MLRVVGGILLWPRWPRWSTWPRWSSISSRSTWFSQPCIYSNTQHVQIPRLSNRSGVSTIYLTTLLDLANLWAQHCKDCHYSLCFLVIQFDPIVQVTLTYRLVPGVLAYHNYHVVLVTQYHPLVVVGQNSPMILFQMVFPFFQIGLAVLVSRFLLVALQVLVFQELRWSCLCSRVG